jgi:RHS repeat-associated protein
VSFDANGNLKTDLNKGISSNITYNSLNLPRTLKFGNTSNPPTNTTADGRLVTAARGSATTQYAGHMIYEGTTLKRILVDGGYIEGSTYYYYLTDHLGNNRVVANASGKEFDKERSLNWSDFETRQYMNDVPMFTTMDPLAEKYYTYSPYAYCMGNPMKYVDLKGDSISVAELYARNAQGELINPNQVKAFEFLASTEEGKALLANYASKGQTIAGVSFNKDGKYHSKGINLSLGVGTRNRTVDGTTAYSIDTFVHEIAIHADQNSVDFIDDKVMNNSNAYPALRNMNKSRGYTQHRQERNVN